MKAARGHNAGRRRGSCVSGRGSGIAAGAGAAHSQGSGVRDVRELGFSGRPAARIDPVLIYAPDYAPNCPAVIIGKQEPRPITPVGARLLSTGYSPSSIGCLEEPMILQARVF
jgi:hypothetical protein